MAAYQEELNVLVQRAANGEIDRQAFESQVEELTVALLLLVFLLGSRLSLSGLAADVMAQMTISANEQVARESARRLAEDVYINGRYTSSETVTQTQATEQRRSRIELWAATLAGLYAIGQTFRQDDPYLMWRVGPTEHCADCLRLNGQVHHASEWRASGWQPQSRVLSCQGYRCQCSLVEIEGPGQGSF